MNSNKEDWVVSIYRHSKETGWNYFQPGSSSSSSSCTKNSQNPRSNSSILPIITATPKSSCIEISHLRVKIPIMKRNDSTGQTIWTRFHRRFDKLLIRLERGSLVLQFSNACDCASFCDVFVSLNQNIVMMEQDDDDDDELEEKGNHETNHVIQTTDDDKEKVSSLKRMNKRRRLGHYQKDENDQQEVHHHHDDELKSYMIHLIHDDDFMAFVDRVENTLASDPSCSKMMQALAVKNSF
jgi:hypothetical protein